MKLKCISFLGAPHAHICISKIALHKLMQSPNTRENSEQSHNHVYGYVYGYGVIELDALRTPRSPVPLFESYRNVDNQTNMDMDMDMEAE